MQIFKWLIKKWKSGIFRLEIYGICALLFMLIFERKILDSFIYTLFIDVLRPLIIDIATDGRLTAYIVTSVVSAIIGKNIFKRNKKEKDDSEGTQ